MRIRMIQPFANERESLRLDKEYDVDDAQGNSLVSAGVAVDADGRAPTRQRQAEPSPASPASPPTSNSEATPAGKARSIKPRGK